jgi:ADP-ribose pyrophosphatase YjhB (NUDIX family)
MRENFTIEDKKTGKIYWISRAVAVVGVIMASDGNEFYFLLEHRGSGCPDNIGKLCSVCGYLNWDETRIEALKRETYEETGLKVKDSQILEFETIDDPKRDAKQNIVTRYLIAYKYSELLEALNNGTINIDTKSRGGEENEVSEFVFLSLSEINSLDSDEFAFGHKELIQDIIVYINNLRKG